MDNTETNLYKLSLLESKIDQISKNSEKVEKEVDFLHDELERLKEKLWNSKETSIIEDANTLSKRIEVVEKQLENIRFELPEMRLTKQIVLGLVTFILTAFLMLAWNVIVVPPTKMTTPNEAVSEIAKKMLEEYKKEEHK